jgi:hypothetical protein
LLLLPLGALGADVYRSVDENGQVVYSDRPENAAAERLVVNTTTATGPAETSRPVSSGNEAAAQAQPAAEIPREATAAEVAADRARNCQIARERAEAYSVSHRLFRAGPDGEREYLSDAELEEARAKAQSDVASWCD